MGKQLKLTPELIPHAHFHKGVWLLSVKRPVWYYFMKKNNPDIIKTKFFIKSVDAPLRKLVKWLHKKGIKTTPSCSGHHLHEKDLKGIYDALERDGQDILVKGLQFKDIESGKIYNYQNASYVLPWSLTQFVRAVQVYQKKGVLGLHLGNRRNIRKQICNPRLPGVKIVESGAITFVFSMKAMGGKLRRYGME